MDSWQALFTGLAHKSIHQCSYGQYRHNFLKGKIMLLKEFEAAAKAAISNTACLRDGVQAANVILESVGLPPFQYFEGTDEAQSLSGDVPAGGSVVVGNILSRRFQRPVWVS